MYVRTVMISALLTAASGCVQRTVSISTQPEGALVWLNDKEVGRTPVKVPFDWYGDYDVVIRKDGHQTLKTHRRLVRPWFEYPPFDLFAEVFVPATIHDDHTWQFDLDASPEVARSELIERAEHMRDQASGESEIETPIEEDDDGGDH